MVMLSDSAVRYAFMICSEKEHYKSGIYCANREMREQVESIVKSLCELYSDSILRTRFSTSDTYVMFKNGSLIRICSASESSRGQKFNLLIFDKEINPNILRVIISPSDIGDRLEYQRYHDEKENKKQFDT